MAPKRAKGCGSSSSSSRSHSKFVSESAHERYKAAKLHRNPHPERGFEFGEVLQYRVLNEFQERQWDEFCKPPRAAIVPLVREFYANAVERTDHKSWVRGKLVDYSPDSINALLQTPPVDHSQYEALVANPDSQAIIHNLCYPGATWTSPSCFPEKYLKETPSMWYYFVARRMMPVGHTSEVHRDRAVLLYALQQHIPIDVGKLIVSQLSLSINNHNISMYFPSMITALCTAMGVEAGEDDEWLHPTRPIDDNTWTLKIMKRRHDFPAHFPIERSTTTPTCSTATTTYSVRANG